MRLIIAGSRTITDYTALTLAFTLGPFPLDTITEIVSGNSRGADMLGEQFSRSHSIPLSLFPARWDEFGKSAGYRRNSEMAAYADALLALWDGSSRGSANMIDTMRALGKPYAVYCPHLPGAIHLSGNLQHIPLFHPKPGSLHHQHSRFNDPVNPVNSAQTRKD